MNQASKSNAYIVVLGIAQDAGYPQINCEKEYCAEAWENSSLQKKPACLAIVDPSTKEQWIVDATPEIKNQLYQLKKISGSNKISGILLTHAHIGHYTGLMYLGKEALNTHKIPVLAMPKMKLFIEKNAPWSQLNDLKNIKLVELNNNLKIHLSNKISISPFLVPHRNEFSETVGYNININNKSIIYVPDIDSWKNLDFSIHDVIKKCDYAFIDGTFYDQNELGRDMKEIPHPTIKDSINLFNSLSEKDKEKIHFIHFNHTNPVISNEKFGKQNVLDKGFNLAYEGQIIRC